MIGRLAIIGVGLIGSSLSLALKKAAAVYSVTGYGRSRDNLQKGVALGVLDDFGSSIAEVVNGADLVVVAVPLGAMRGVFAEIAAAVGASEAQRDLVITDVGSSKGSVIEAARAELGGLLPRFVPGHPIAGNEKSGVEAGFASLYQSRRVILTPLEETDDDALARVDDMWSQCGAIVEKLDFAHHDRVLAATSHLPHMLAYALVHHLSHLNDNEEIFRYAAGGFRDFSRIASSDPVMWRDVCLNNGLPLLELIGQYQRDLDRIAAAIRDGDAVRLYDLFSRAKSQRDGLIGNC